MATRRQLQFLQPTSVPNWWEPWVFTSSVFLVAYLTFEPCEEMLLVPILCYQTARWSWPWCI